MEQFNNNISEHKQNINSFRWLVPGMLVTYSHFPSCDHLPGFPRLREGLNAWSWTALAVASIWDVCYTRSQALGRWMPLSGNTGNQICDQGSGPQFALTLTGLEVMGVKAIPWGYPGPLPAVYIFTPWYDIKSLNCEAPIYICATDMETSVIRVGMGKDPAVGSGRITGVLLF